MKNLLVALVLSLLIVACRDKEQEKYIVDITRENDSLIDVIQVKNLELEEITGSMNAIETNLAAIRRNEVVIDNLKKEGNVKQVQKVNAMIREIDSYMEENRQQIEKLEKQVKSSRSRISGLEKLVALQRQAVEEKEQQIQELLGTITFLREELQNTIVKKDAEIEQREKEISKVVNEKETLINTAFYRFGSRDELMQDGIVQKEGKLH
jgi:chromosome segregation ATPase